MSDTPVATTDDASIEMPASELAASDVGLENSLDNQVDAVVGGVADVAASFGASVVNATQNLPPFVHTGVDFALQGVNLAKSWLLSPAAWSQFGLLVLAFLVARGLTRKFMPKIQRFLTPAEGALGVVSEARNISILFLPLGLPLLAYALTGMGEGVTRALFGSGAVIALGKRIFLFLAVKALVDSVLTDPFLKLLGKYILIPIAAFYVVGILDPVAVKLAETTVGAGNIRFSLMSVIRGVIAGAVLFWLGRWSTGHSRTYIGGQEAMRPATRELASKAVEMAIFGVLFLLLMNIIGMDLSSLAVLSGAIGVGLGFGLQKIASNFISGVILLMEGQATVGDFVALDGGEEGKIVKMTARAAILETFDGRWIVVPNEDFIVTRVVNYSDSGSANRYEAEFSVSYDTDINLIPDLIADAVSKHPDVLDAPYPADCELRGFGDSGIDFAVEFWVNGLDDGPNKYTSDVLFIIWNTLKDNNINIPYPHQVVEFKNGLPK